MTNKQSAGVRPEVEIDRMIDEFGAFGVDWAEFSQQLSNRKARFPARPHGAVQTAVMARNTSVRPAAGAIPVAVTGDGEHRGRHAESARPSLPDR